ESFTQSVLVYLTALDSSSDFLAVGSSIGMLYLYCRRLAHMNKYSLEGKSDAITAVKLLSCFDDLVAVGTASGRVAVFQLVSPLPGRNKQLRRFDVVGLHKGSVTSLAWSTNGMKLFSGDDKGRVVFSSLDLDQGVCKPVLLLEESSGVVQMEYSHQVLLVSTQQRSLLYCTQKQEVQQLGTKPRKSSGRFGACFLPGLCKQSDLQVFAARPGLRLWRSDIRGQVEETRLLKPLFNTQVLWEGHLSEPRYCSYSERQLGLLSCFLREGWILSWNEYSIYVLDCINEVIIGTLESSGDIVSVSCCDNEIFILKGDRDIIRLSNSPEGLASNCEYYYSSSCCSSEGVEEVEEAEEQLEVTEQLCQRSGVFTSSSRSRSSSVTSWDSLHGNGPGTTSCELNSRRYSAPLGQGEMQQELVVKAIRVKKKKRRRQVCQQVFSLLLSLSVQLAESWMGYSGPGCGILSLQVTDRFVWCLDFKGGLFCSTLPETGLTWQRFEDNVHQVALSPSGNLLWKVEQKSMTAFACAKVSVKGKRHWYKAVEQTAFVALSDDSAWIIRTNGDLYLQTGLSVDRPCARSVKVDSPCVFSQVCVRGGVVWALSEHKALFYREGLNSYCSEGEGWKYDTVSEAQGLELMCVALGDGGTAWALDASGSLWFRTGICSSRPQGDDDHWWQISISDYVVFDQGSLFQTLLHATQSVATVTRAPVERVVAFLSQYSQCQPSLVSANASGVWVASGRNQLHLARGSLVGTFWQNVVPRGTVSATRWTFVTSSAVPHREGTFLWLAQSRKDLFCVWDQDGELRPSSVPLPPEVELTHLSACRDALWGLDIHGRVSIRTLSPSCPAGLNWTPLDLSQLGSVRLVSVSCGSQNVWAVDSRGVVYFRVGTQPLNPSMMLPAWIHIEPPVQVTHTDWIHIEPPVQVTHTDWIHIEPPVQVTHTDWIHIEPPVQVTHTDWIHIEPPVQVTHTHWIHIEPPVQVTHTDWIHIEPPVQVTHTDWIHIEPPVQVTHTDWIHIEPPVQVTHTDWIHIEPPVQVTHTDWIHIEPPVQVTHTHWIHIEPPVQVTHTDWIHIDPPVQVTHTHWIHIEPPVQVTHTDWIHIEPPVQVTHTDWIHIEPPVQVTHTDWIHIEPPVQVTHTDWIHIEPPVQVTHTHWIHIDPPVHRV
uniref:HPS5-like beta-propeller domain-containing protein n=1 Tax=Dicentrarchus labrax TaxID=13489 RepID=A0A8P4KHA5_DICLA